MLIHVLVGLGGVNTGKPTDCADYLTWQSMRIPPDRWSSKLTYRRLRSPITTMMTQVSHCLTHTTYRESKLKAQTHKGYNRITQ